MLNVDVFGGIAAVDSRNAGSLALSRAGQELLGCLVLVAADRPLRREALAEMLWPDCDLDASRQRLRSALWRLRRSLGTGLRAAVCHDGDRVWCDRNHLAPLPHARFAETIETCCAGPVEAMTAEDFRHLDAALELYAAPVMDGFDSTWILPHRERFAELYCRGLERQITWYRTHGNPEATIRAGRTLLREDPYREDVHAMLIGLYAAAGQPRRALRQFHDCRAAIEEDLGVAPTNARAALQKALVAPAQPAAPAGAGVRIDEILEGLQQTIQTLNRQIGVLRTALQGTTR